MAVINQVTQPIENSTSEDFIPQVTTVIRSKTDSGLIRFIIQSIVLFAILVWSQTGHLTQSCTSPLSNYNASSSAVDFASMFTAAQPEVNRPSVYSTEQKNCIGSDDDQARFNPESKNLVRTIMSIAKLEVVDESIHPGNYTPSASNAIQREAVNQRSDTFFNKQTNKKTSIKAEKQKKKKKITPSGKNRPVGSIVYTGAHFRDMDSYETSSVSKTSNKHTHISPQDVAIKPSEPNAPFTSLSSTKEETAPAKKAAKVGRTKLVLSTLNVTSLKFSNIAAREEVASIKRSDNVSTTKHQTNNSNNLTVGGTEATASVSSTQASTAKPQITSAQFKELKWRAVEEDKLLIVRFTATWCMPCKVMEKNVYANPEVKGYMDQHFLSMKLDSDSFDGINMKQMYDVQMIPSFLIFKSNGELVGHHKKSISATAMLDILKDHKARLNVLSKADGLTKSENDNIDWQTQLTPITK